MQQAVRVSLICWTGAPQGLLELLLCCDFPRWLSGQRPYSVTLPALGHSAALENHTSQQPCVLKWPSSEFIWKIHACSVQMWAWFQLWSVCSWEALGCFQSYTRQTARRFCCVAVLEVSQFLTIQSDLDKRITAWMLELLFEALGWLSSCWLAWCSGRRALSLSRAVCQLEVTDGTSCSRQKPTMHAWKKLWQ